ncbi:MAG: YggT family protein [Frankiaceae bacterium]|jgi:YggT family protein|nr:YggT family protein [Frankiaceae bacterium]MDX6225969.1 YggT family protein [Frankiales bacterium]MDX6274525.1 YggT family protein [Frankiales bacterium]
MHNVGQVLALLLQIYFVLLIFRLIMEYVFMFARSFRPSGLLAAALELTYTVTDPPLRAVRRVLPPLRVANFSLDLGFLVVIIVVQILASVAAGL